MQWLSHSSLKCNDAKTEFMFICKANQAPDCADLKVGMSQIAVKKHVKNLGVILDSNMNMSKFITCKCQSLNYSLNNLRQIRKYLTKNASEILVNAYITSKLDYCNSILYGLPKSHIRPLQLIQNRAARLICGTGNREHIIPVLKELHWLPVKARILFKIVLTVYKCLNDSGPQYLANELIFRTQHFNLRSSQAVQLYRPQSYDSFNSRETLVPHYGPTCLTI